MMKQEYKFLSLLTVLLLLCLTALGCAATPGIENSPTAAAEATASALTTNDTTTQPSDTDVPDTTTETPGPTDLPTSSPAPTNTPAPGSTTAKSTATPAPTPINVTTSQWVMKEISFTSPYGDDGIIASGATSTFETASVPSDWTAFSGGSLSVSSTVAHSGNKSLCYSGRNYAWSSPCINIYSAVKKGGAGTYKISFWLYADILPAESSSGRILIRGKSSADENSFITLAGTNYMASISTSFTTPQKTWVKYSASVNVLASDITRTSGNFLLVIDSLGVSTGQKIYIDDFQITKPHYDSSFEDVQMDVTFTGPGGTKLTIPAFWDGGTTWKVRFAPTKTGTWTFKTTCSDTSNTGLHNITGTVNATAYIGSLEIYKHGFIKISSNNRYFTYADGTPFFYLGDTHWSMPTELFDSSGIPNIASQFKYIVDKRVSQGFTVYQSEPIGAGYTLTNGLQDDDIAGFTDLDRRFDYIAEKGLVHANAELFFKNDLVTYSDAYDDAYLEKLCRYWVARYGAYPVMWTTGQEVDNDIYYNRADGGQTKFDAAHNPWHKVAEWIHQYDAYSQPLTAHMEFASTTNADGCVASTSSFTNISGHNWYAAQWSPGKSAQASFAVPKDFWYNSVTKPTVNYEGCYDYLWTKEFGARAQGWNAYLNGMYGHGYGAIDIWLYNSKYNADVPTTRDGETITVEEKATKWNVSIEFAAGYQLGYMHQFLAKLEWWKLVPRFDDTAYFVNSGSYYTVASDGNNVYVAYFYNANQKTGTLKGLNNSSQYTAQWYNPRTNQYGSASTFTPSGGAYTIGNKPDSSDWILLVKKK